MGNTLSSEILKIINANANNNPPPELCLIEKISNGYLNIALNRGNRHLINIQYLGTPKLNDIGIVIYPDGKENAPLVLCLGSISIEEFVSELITELNKDV